MQILYEPVAVKHGKIIFLLDPANQGKAIENSLEKAKNDVLSRNFFKQKPLRYAARAGMGEIIL